MMKAPSNLTPSEVAKALPLPKVGEVINGKKVHQQAGVLKSMPM